MTQDLDRLMQLMHAELVVGSGVYTAIDPAIHIAMDERGIYTYRGLDDHYRGPAGALLRVSAFGDLAPSEPELAADLFSQQRGSKNHPIVGHYLECYAGWSTTQTREAGSSGGLTTWLLARLLELNEVDGVIHLRPGVEGRPLFEYAISRTPAEVKAASRSRYYPAELSRQLHEIAAGNDRYAIVAIPSIAYEIRLLQREVPGFAERLPYVVGLICGHQKSANYAEYIGWRAGVRPGGLTDIDFRHKIPGRPASSYGTKIESIDGGRKRESVLGNESIMGTDWGLGMFKEKFSDYTEDAFNETSDVVFGDAWLDPYVEDSRGTNIVIVRDARILRLLEEGRAAKEIHLETIGTDKVVASQEALVRHTVTELPFRLTALEAAADVARPPRRRTSARIGYFRKVMQTERLAMSRGSHSAYLEARRAGTLQEFDRAMAPHLKRYNRARRLARLAQVIRRGPRHWLHAVLRRLTERGASLGGTPWSRHR